MDDDIKIFVDESVIFEKASGGLTIGKEHFIILPLNDTRGRLYVFTDGKHETRLRIWRPNEQETG